MVRMTCFAPAWVSVSVSRDDAALRHTSDDRFAPFDAIVDLARAGAQLSIRVRCRLLVRQSACQPPALEVPVEPAHWRSGVIDMTRLLPRLPALSFCFGDEY